MKISAAFPSDYLKCADLGEQPRLVTIRTCVQEWLGQGKDKEQKPVLYFEKGPKGLVLNKTNAKTIVKAYGDDTTGWPRQDAVSPAKSRGCDQVPAAGHQPEST